jgi:protein SCO1/2
MLVFFGFTYCPDICPTELQVMMSALDRLGPAAERITPVFITVDPERDTPEVLKSYVGNFGPRLQGLTGTAQDIAAVAKAYRVHYAKAANPTAPDDYLMDHTSIMYLMDPDGRFVRHFPYTTDAGKLAEGLEEALAPSL